MTCGIWPGFSGKSSRVSKVYACNNRTSLKCNLSGASLVSSSGCWGTFIWKKHQSSPFLSRSNIASTRGFYLAHGHGHASGNRHGLSSCAASSRSMPQNYHRDLRHLHSEYHGVTSCNLSVPLSTSKIKDSRDHHPDERASQRASRTS